MYPFRDIVAVGGLKAFTEILVNRFEVAEMLDG
jgi:hypothetical protein